MRVHKALLDPTECHLTVVIPSDRMILAQKFEESLTGSGELQYEPCYIVQAPQVTSDFLFGAQLRHLKDGLYLFGVHLYPFLTYDETKQFSRLDPDGALSGVQS